MIKLASLSRSLSCLRAPSIFALLSAPILTLSLVGCGVSPAVMDTPASSPAAITGTIYGGQQPIVGAFIGLYAMGSAGYGTGGGQIIDSSTSGPGGFFQLAPQNAASCLAAGFQANTPVYLLGSGGNPGYGGNNPSIAFAAAIGTCANVANVMVNMNEVTTVATAYALSSFFPPSLGSGTQDTFGSPTTGTYPALVYPTGLLNAMNQTIPRLVHLNDGTPNVQNPNVIVENLKLYSIANILAACVNSTGSTGPTDSTTICGKIFGAAKPANYARRPFDTLQLAIALSVAPYSNTSTLMNLAGVTVPFQPALATAPHDWTLGIAYSDFGVGLAINPSTTSNLAIDVSGKVWVPVTYPNGALVYLDPSVSSGSPFTTVPNIGGIVHPEQVAIDHSGYVWVTDDLSGLIAGVLSTSPGTLKGPLGATSPNDRTVALAMGPDDLIYTAHYDAYDTGTSGKTKIVNLARTTVNTTAGFEDLFGFPTAMAVDGIYSGGTLTSLNQYDSTTYGTYGTGNTAHVDDSYFSPGVSPNHGQPAAYPGNSGQVALSIDTSGNPPDPIQTNPAGSQICSASYGCIISNPPSFSFSTPEGVAVDGQNSVWIANSGNASVTQIPGASAFYSNSSSAGIGSAIHDSSTAGGQYYNGNTLTQPYGIGIDASGNVWVSNAGCVATFTAAPAFTPCTPGPLVITELVGLAAPTIVPLSAQTYHATSLNASIGVRP